MHRIGTGLVIVTTVFCVACGGGAASPVAPTASAQSPQTASSPPSAPAPTSCLPGAPTNLQLASIGNNRTFTWNVAASASEYFILIGSASGRSDVLETNTTQTAYNWNGSPRGTYFARVYARNSCGSGPNSNEIAFN